MAKLFVKCADCGIRRSLPPGQECPQDWVMNHDGQKLCTDCLLRVVNRHFFRLSLRPQIAFINKELAS